MASQLVEERSEGAEAEAEPAEQKGHMIVNCRPQSLFSFACMSASTRRMILIRHES